MSEKLGNFISRYRKLILILLDILVVTVSYLLPWAMIQGRVQVALYYPVLVSSCFFFICCFEIVFALMGMYDSLWRYAEIVEFFKLVLACVIAVAMFLAGSLIIFNERMVPISVFFLSALFATSVTLYSRLTYRMYRNTRVAQQGKQRRRRVMVIGAGEAAATLLHEQNRNPDQNMNIICLVDDAPQKVGRSIMGVQIMGTTDKIPELATQCEIDTIILAIPSLEEENRQRILRLCSQTKCNMRILPDLRQIMSDGGEMRDRIRDVRVEDLLGRDTVQLSGLSSALLGGKTVMVTGGGGSIGSELCLSLIHI